MPSGVYKHKKQSAETIAKRVAKLLGQKRTEETRRRMSIAQTKENVGYSAIHEWLKRTYGNANRCEMIGCNGTSKNFQWAKIKEREYLKERNNFLMLCVSCHRKYDFTEELRKKISRPVGKYKDGVLLESYMGISDAARKNNGCNQNICKAAQGKYKTSYGFEWKFL